MNCKVMELAVYSKSLHDVLEHIMIDSEPSFGSVQEWYDPRRSIEYIISDDPHTEHTLLIALHLQPGQCFQIPNYLRWFSKHHILDKV
jgi:hypothetical protein